jgi:chaperonin GroES
VVIISTLGYRVLRCLIQKTGGGAMKLQPLGDRVVVKPLDAETKSKGGILIPDTAKEKPQQGEIVAVGKGKILENGTIAGLEVKVGDKVLYGKYSGNEFTNKDGEELLIMREEDILAIIK